MIKSPTTPIKNTGIRIISPKTATNNCNGIEAHNTKKQLTVLYTEKSRNTPLFIVKYTVKNRYTMLIKKQLRESIQINGGIKNVNGA